MEYLLKSMFALCWCTMLICKINKKMFFQKEKKISLKDNFELEMNKIFATKM